MTSPLSPQVQEWRKEAERLVDAVLTASHRDGMLRQCKLLPEARAALLAHLSAVPFNQVVQEPVAWKIDWLPNPEMGRAGGWTSRLLDHEPSPQELGPGDKVFALYAQPVRGEGATGPREQFLADSLEHGIKGAVARFREPGEALPAEQPKSDQANLESASGGNDLQTALPCVEPVPPRVYWAPLADNFYDADGKGQGTEFYLKWKPRRTEFPQGESFGWGKGSAHNPFKDFPRDPALAACEASAGSAGSNKKAPESSSASPVEAVEVLRELLACKEAPAAPDDRRTWNERWQAAWDRARKLVAQPPQSVQEVRMLPPEGSVGETFIEPRADPILVLVSDYGGACMEAVEVRRADNQPEFDRRHKVASALWMELGRAILALREKAEPKVTPAKPDCPHAAPFRYCQRCKASPCPIGLDGNAAAATEPKQ